MAEEQPQPQRDTTFDEIKPESVWLTFENFRRKDNFTITLEVNGIKKVIRDFYIPGLALDEGITSESHNLTWLTKSAQKREGES